MKFYIITPSYQSLKWLRCCVRSVADQVGEGVEVHHHVQDGGSADGTPEWLAAWQQEHADVRGYTFTYESGRDAGMYDALNKAWEKLPQDADVTAHLNSDEQYLPGVLSEVAAKMKAAPKTSMVIGSVILLEADGSYHCHRRCVKPHLWSSYTGCEILTCTCFHRVSDFRRHGVRFDSRYRSIGDLVFFRDIMLRNPRVCVCADLFISAYTLTGNNLAWTDATREDSRIYWPTVPRWRCLIHPIVYRVVNFKRRIIDRFCAAPAAYSVYLGDADTRTERLIEKPSCIWRKCGYAANETQE